jgi:hypothetical protein
MVYIKNNTVSKIPKARLLYIMGATWHNQCMFDLDIENNFSTILNNYGIETYSFNIVGSGPQPKTEFIGDKHEDNVRIAEELIKQYDIDFIMGYSYGCKVVADVIKNVNLKAAILLDPLVKIEIKTESIDNDDKIQLSKDNILQSIIQYQATINDSILKKHLQELCAGDTIVTASYPRLARKTTMLSSTLPKQIFFTKNSNLEHRSKFLEHVVKFYPNASHWILLEEYRKDLAADINNFILQHK